MVVASTMAFSASVSLFLTAVLSLPGLGTASRSYSKHLHCDLCGEHSAMVNPVLLAMFVLLNDLIKNMDVALCLTLHVVYITVIILEQVLVRRLSDIVSGLVFLLKKVSNEHHFSQLLELTGLLLTGVFSCVLTVLETNLIW